MKKGVRLKRGGLVGSNKRKTTTVISLGHYYSEVLRGNLYIALKEYHDDPKRPMYAFISELAIIRGVERYLPQLLPEFPVFHGLLLNSKGEPIGVLTEDFSEGERYKVEDMARSVWDSFPEGMLPEEFETIAGSPTDKHELATTCFLVNGKRRIGDFGELRMALTPENWIEKFPYSDIERDIDKYTLKIDYPL